MPRLVRYDNQKQNLLGWITELNELSGLIYCFDAGDVDSYDGSGQPWNDISGVGNHLWRGSNNTSESSDPTFNGSGDGLSSAEFFSFNGSQLFTPQSQPLSGVGNFHRDGAVFTIISVFNPQIPTGADILVQGFLQNSASLGAVFRYGIGAGVNSGKQNLSVSTSGGVGGAVLNAFSSTASFSSGDNGSWAVAGLKIDEGSGGGEFIKNSTIESFSPSYSSPDTSSLVSSQIFRTNTGGWKTGNEIAMGAAWSRRLSDQSYNDLYAKIKQRFTTLP